MGCAVHPTLSPPQSPMQKARRQQMDMIAELKKKQMVKEPLIYEGKDGAIEDIISGEGQGVSPGAWRSESLARPCQNRVPWGAGPLGGCHGLSHSPAMAGREHSAGRDPETVRAGQLLGRWELEIQGWAPSSAAPARGFDAWGFGTDSAAAKWVQLGEPPWRGL